MFVDGVVEHLRDAVVQRPFVGAADVHAGLFADRFQPLELAYFRGIIDAFTHTGIEVENLVAAFG